MKDNENREAIQFYKLYDWTGLTRDSNYRQNVNYAIDKNNVLYASYSFSNDGVNDFYKH